MIDPAFQFAQRTDDHPVGDIRAGQRWLRSVFQAFAQSPQWKRGAFVVALRRVGRLLRPREAAARAGHAGGEGPTAGSRSSASACPAIVASPFARAGLRRPHRLRPHVGAAAARVALPRRARPRGPRAGKRGTVVAHRARPPRRTTSAPRSRPSSRPTSASTRPWTCPRRQIRAPSAPRAGRRDDGDPFDSSQQMSDLQDSRFKEASPKPVELTPA